MPCEVLQQPLWAQKWWRWRLCSDTPIAPQNPVFLSIPRSRLARYDTSSAAFRLLIYGEKVGKKPSHGEEMGNFWKPPDREPIRLLVCLRLENMPFFPFYGEEMGNFWMPISQSPNRESHRFPDSLGLKNIPLFLLIFKSNGGETGKKKRDR